MRHNNMSTGRLIGRLRRILFYMIALCLFSTVASICARSFSIPIGDSNCGLMAGAVFYYAEQYSDAPLVIRWESASELWSMWKHYGIQPRLVMQGRAIQFVSIPVVAVLLLCVCVLLATYCVASESQKPNGCHVCGYDLTLNQTGICPECGSPIGKPSRRVR